MNRAVITFICVGTAEWKVLPDSAAGERKHHTENHSASGTGYEPESIGTEMPGSENRERIRSEEKTAIAGKAFGWDCDRCGLSGNEPTVRITASGN